MAQLGAATLDQSVIINGKPRLDLNHAYSPECYRIYRAAH
jgi:hypothetical protein